MEMNAEVQYLASSTAKPAMVTERTPIETLKKSKAFRVLFLEGDGDGGEGAEEGTEEGEE